MKILKTSLLCFVVLSAGMMIFVWFINGSTSVEMPLKKANPSKYVGKRIDSNQVGLMLGIFALLSIGFGVLNNAVDKEKERTLKRDSESIPD